MHKMKAVLIIMFKQCTSSGVLNVHKCSENIVGTEKSNVHLLSFIHFFFSSFLRGAEVTIAGTNTVLQKGHRYTVQEDMAESTA